MAGYFTYVTSYNKPPADMAALAVSIMNRAMLLQNCAIGQLAFWGYRPISECLPKLPSNNILPGLIFLRQEFGCAQASGRRRSSKRLPEEAPARRALGYPPTLH
ncbi:hypothetical protein NKI80_29635 [Mesorhizobium sp. M0387]|uniref:hypothetical protein n=1 Tax=Mesorhizobium sp. M0387 TaxID=2956940 RepID=UPI003338AC91